MEVVVTDTHRKVRGHRLAGRSWSKAGVVLRFDDAGEAEAPVRDLERLDLDSHPELAVVGDPFPVEFVVVVDSTDELHLLDGQTLTAGQAAPKTKAAKK